MAVDLVVVKALVPGTVEIGAATSVRIPLTFMQHAAWR
jgi:hypothetical protein